MKRAEFKCQANKAEVWIYDVIGADFWGEGVSAKHFLEDLAALPSAVNELTVRINSPGGSVFDGNAIANALTRHPARVVVAVDGVAASAASRVAITGDHITMAENAMMMIHRASGGMHGRADDHRGIADVLDKIDDSLVEAYATVSGQSAEQIEAWLDAETWFTAAEALEAGLSHETTGSLQVAACIPPDLYANAPKDRVIVPASQNGSQNVITCEPPHSEGTAPWQRNLREKVLQLHPT